MKKKWKYEIVNNQEDEDGYSHYPESVLLDETAKGKHNISSNRMIANTESGSAKFVMIFPEAKRRISQLLISTSARLADPTLPAGRQVATGTMGKQKNHY